MEYRRIALVGIDGSGKSSLFKGIIEKLTYPDFAAIGDSLTIHKNGVSEKAPGVIFKLSAFLGKNVKEVDNRLLYKLLLEINNTMIVKVKNLPMNISFIRYKNKAYSKKSELIKQIFKKFLQNYYI